MLEDKIKQIRESVDKVSGDTAWMEIKHVKDKFGVEEGNRLADLFLSYVGKDSFDSVVDCMSVMEQTYDVDNFTKVVDTLETYVDRNGVGKVGWYLYRSVSKKRQVGFTCKMFTAPSILEVFDKYNDHPQVMEIVDEVGNLIEKGNSMESIVKRMDGLHYPRTFKFLHENEAILNSFVIQYSVWEDREFFDKVFEVLEKYDRHNVLISEIYMGKSQTAFMPDRFLNERAYNAIINSNNPREMIRKVNEKNYDQIADHLWGDPDFRYNISIKDLDLTQNTIDMVMRVHKERKSDDRIKIRRSYWDELNRAVNQADDYNGKLRNLRQYCYEVRKQVKDNADELMLVQ